MAHITFDLAPLLERQRKENLKECTALLKKERAAWKKETTTLKQQLSLLQRALARVESGRESSSVQEVQRSVPQFSPELLCAHRAKLGLSAQDYAILAGVSALSIYKWESGRTRPVPAKRSLLAEVQRLNKGEALERLEKLKARAAKR